MKKTFSMLFFILALHGESGWALGLKGNDKLEKHRCKNEIQKMAEQWIGTKEWKPHINDVGSLILIRPTQKFAHWLVVEKNEGLESITLMNPSQAQQVSFDQKCQGTLTIYNHRQYSNSNGMNDQRLLKEMIKNRQGVFALWSPHVAHSVTAIERLQKVSTELKIPVTFIMDQFANEEMAKNTLKQRKIKLNKITKLSSLELAYRDAGLQYPNFFVYKNGQIVGNMNPGLMSEADYKQAINHYLVKKGQL